VITEGGAAQPAPLDGLSVADLSDSIAGQFATRLLADHGATVTLFERSPGSVTRRQGPFRKGVSHSASLLFWHLNSGKSSSCSDIDPLAAAAERSATGAPTFDVLVVSDHGTARRALELFPDTIVAAVTDFADDGPYASWTGSELVHQALSGSMFYNGSAGRKPLYGTGHRASYAAGLHLYIRIMSELVAGLRGSSSARQVRVVVHEAAAAMEQNFSTQWAYSRTIPQRGEWNRPKGRVPCRDGWVVFFGGARRRRELFEAFGAEDLADDPRFAEWAEFVRHIDQACAEFARRSTDLTQEQLLTSAIRDRLVLSPARRLGDLRTEAHLVARDFWVRVPVPEGSRTALGEMWRSDGFASRRPSPAPAPNEHRDEAGGPAGWRVGPGSRVCVRAEGAASEGRSDEAGPLHGLRVVDFTSAWAGPMATRILLALGAEVIKVEGPSRMDGWRGHPSHPTHLESYPQSRPGPRPYNRNAWFNTQNAGKKAIAVDLKDPRGHRVVCSLVERSDMVIANFSPGTMSRLGLGFDALARINPRLVMVEMSGFGDTGPLREHRGLGQTMEAMAGITSLIGYPDDEPLGSGSAYLDPMGGLAGAAAALTAVVHRLRSSTAQRVEVPQREAAMHWIGEQILDAIENGTEYLPRGNARPDAFPHDAFPAQGLDEWIAIAVLTERQWVALCELCGWPEWRDDPRLRTVDGRLARAADIDAALTRASSRMCKEDFARRLQAVGIPAAPVQNGRDLFADRQLRHRGWFTTLDHSEVGRHDYPGVPVEISGRLSRPRGPAPLLGQHTAAVLREVVGLRHDEIADLADAGVIVCAGS
jgi:crotonobetainyl-CoA:carnitine CoA-transferase CaiB-like acyl-CoA transferase